MLIRMFLQKFKIFDRMIFTSSFPKRIFLKTTLYFRNYNRYRYAVFDIKFLMKKDPQKPISVFAHLIWIMEFPFKSVEFGPPCTGLLVIFSPPI